MKKFLLFLLLFVTQSTLANLITNTVVDGCSGEVLGINDNVTIEAIFEPINTTCQPGYYLPVNTLKCEQCPSEATCSPGTYSFSETKSRGIVYNDVISYDKPYGCAQNLLGFDDKVSFDAVFRPMVITCNPGYYLLANNIECTQCPENNYCVGGTYTFDETITQGITTCPTTYPNSEIGAGSDTQCYTSCAVDTVSKASKVTGNDYYGNGIDTCEPAECIAGWHIKSGLNLNDTIGEESSTNSAHIDNTGSFNEMNYYGNNTNNQDYYGISDTNSFAVDYGVYGMVTGHGYCSNTQPNNTPNIFDNITDQTGHENATSCYCQINKFTPVGGQETIITSAPWVYNDEASCDKQSCAQQCANSLAHSLEYRYIIFEASTPLKTCEKNTININWNPDNENTHTINQCTYEESIILPSDPVKPGYTFTGWKLVE